MVLDESPSNTLDKEDIQGGIDEENDDFGSWVPAGIYLGEPTQLLAGYTTAGRGIILLVGIYRMGWNPNAKDGNLNTSYEKSGTPLQFRQQMQIFSIGVLVGAYLDLSHQSSIVNNNSSPINNDLHEKLNLPNPAKETHEKHRDTIYG
jgi:hypothetical protein